MVKQERAARTRHALVKAAAVEFDRAGYEGTSLARISETAGISMGALTFHFRTKGELAVAVQRLGRSATQDVVTRVAAHPAPALQSVIALTLELARLLEKEASVRAAARLTREMPATTAATAWYPAWTHTVDELLEQARDGELRPGTDLRTVAALVAHLVAGAETHIRCRVPHTEHQSADAQLAQLWRLVLRGVSANPT
ncbi:MULTISPECIES: ScbR family autoregulator-binding transcription factor [Kitasatospora]|uniref:Putative TetR family transcriptional regulator n=1 Tax=Kitasatospora setae (strain ATCC 33774 / DSM 43861 / JCM 3304 / KCC A-0304 / NBRC 14216 / KM-6054) TaxID=452652 RepID=E4N422_KITSK|nr:ScbR family autoregulator-binding transcription factor [Kitasatospora setae]BAJ25953.1 putative TetR family transcriptional regulator [Kitasatospora setae KM-6054]BAJ33325.1 putative TetR family transcriptional regulator [Kitasatospora setae KM-6054]